MYYGARYYDPSLGRFTSADSIIPEQSQGVQAWDRYAYTNNNPVRYTDPTGHCIWDLCIIEIGVVSIGLVELSALTFATITTVVIYTPGGQERANSLANNIVETGNEISDSLTSVFAHKRDVGYIDYLMKKYGLDKSYRRILHDLITRQGMTNEEVEIEAAELARQKAQKENDTKDETANEDSDPESK